MRLTAVGISLVCLTALAVVGAERAWPPRTVRVVLLSAAVPSADGTAADGQTLSSLGPGLRASQRPRWCLPWDGCDPFSNPEPPSREVPLGLRPRPLPDAPTEPGPPESGARTAAAGVWTATLPGRPWEPRTEELTLRFGPEDRPWIRTIGLSPSGGAPGPVGVSNVLALDWATPTAPLAVDAGSGLVELRVDPTPFVRVSIDGTGHCGQAGRAGWADGRHPSGASDYGGVLHLVGTPLPVPILIGDVDPMGLRRDPDEHVACAARLLPGSAPPAWVVSGADSQPRRAVPADSLRHETSASCDGVDATLDAACTEVLLRGAPTGACTLVLWATRPGDTMVGLELRGLALAHPPPPGQTPAPGAPPHER